MVSQTLKVVDNEDVNIGITDEKRTKVAQKLCKFLASTYMLYMKTLYYHWNVTGKQFHSLHEMFEDQYQDLHSAGDELAERIRALGHFTPGTFREYIELSSIEEDKKLPENAEAMISALLKDNQTCSIEARKVLETAEDAGDEVTIDMMVERMSTHDENAWMLRATLE